jgi:hypothetical protein
VAHLTRVGIVQFEIVSKPKARKPRLAPTRTYPQFVWSNGRGLFTHPIIVVSSPIDVPEKIYDTRKLHMQI